MLKFLVLRPSIVSSLSPVYSSPRILVVNVFSLLLLLSLFIHPHLSLLRQSTFSPLIAPPTPLLPSTLAPPIAPSTFCCGSSHFLFFATPQSMQQICIITSHNHFRINAMHLLALYQSSRHQSSWSKREGTESWSGTEIPGYQEWEWDPDPDPDPGPGPDQTQPQGES